MSTASGATWTEPELYLWDNLLVDQSPVLTKVILAREPFLSSTHTAANRTIEQFLRLSISSDMVVSCMTVAIKSAPVLES